MAGLTATRTRRGGVYAGGIGVFLVLALLAVPNAAARWVFPCIAALWLAAVVWERRSDSRRPSEAWGLADEVRLAVMLLVIGVVASLCIGWLTSLGGSSAM